MSPGAILSLGVGLKSKVRYPFVLIDWPDLGTIPVKTLKELVAWLREAGKEKHIEISCIGGHGRTGTVLAAVAIEERGLSAEKAIKWVRKNYCDKAVEGLEQENLLREFNGEETKAAAPKTTPTTVIGKSSLLAKPLNTTVHTSLCKCDSCMELRMHAANCWCDLCRNRFGTSVVPKDATKEVIYRT